MRSTVSAWAAPQQASTAARATDHRTKCRLQRRAKLSGRFMAHLPSHWDNATQRDASKLNAGTGPTVAGAPIENNPGGSRMAPARPLLYDSSKGDENADRTAPFTARGQRGRDLGRTRHRPGARRLAERTDQVRRALPARRLDRSGGAPHPGADHGDDGLADRGRQQARRRRHGGRGDRRQIPARRPDLAGGVRQPHPDRALRRRQHALQGFRSSKRHAGRPRTAGHRLPSRPTLQDLRRRHRRRTAAAGQAQRRRAHCQPGAAVDHPPPERETASTST